MYKVLIYGAGSIGNHLCYACRQRGWDVEIFDIDPAALDRTRREIYPQRYGEWDSGILLTESLDSSKYYDLIIVGTPPDSHMNLVTDILASYSPRVLLVEKPLCTPSLDGLDGILKVGHDSNCLILVGYNHNLTKNTQRAGAILEGGDIGTPKSIHIRWLEHWGGIFNAHPWLDGPADTYLGYYHRGGGACAEHSHAVSLWQHFARVLKAGSVVNVTGIMDIYKDDTVEYDQTAQILLATESGLIGSVIQDVITQPPQKTMRIQGTRGYLEWYANYDNAHDAIVYRLADGEENIETFEKGRPDDFSGQMDQIAELLTGGVHVEHVNGLVDAAKTMEIIAAAHLSNKVGHTVDLRILDWQDSLVH